MATKEAYKIINEETKKLLFLSDEDRLEMLNNILECSNDNKEKFIFAACYIYGLRPAELIMLRRGWLSVKEDTLWIRIPTKKGGDERIIVLGLGVPFMDFITNYISNIDDPEALLFDFKHPSNFNHIINRMVKRYNLKFGSSIKITPYVFRKFRLSWILSSGGSVTDVLAYKGGKSLKPLENSYIFLRPVNRFKDSLK